MRVYINGETRELSGTPSLAELISELDLPVARIAVEVNRVVVRRSDWSTTLLHDKDRLEIVHFVGGGSASQQTEQETAAVRLDSEMGVEFRTVKRTTKD